MRCKYCGEIIEEDYKFCISCGKPVQDSIDEYNKQKNEQSIEYFEIENHEEEKDSNYDFSQFLYDESEEELEEIHFSTEHDTVEDKEEMGNQDRDYSNETQRQDFEDDLEDTKKRVLFERSDYNFFESIKRKNKENKKKKEIRDQYNDEEEEKRESFKEYRERSNDEYEEMERNILKSNRRSKFYKRVRNLIYNIIVAVGVWLLFSTFGDRVLSILLEWLPQLYMVSYRILEIGLLILLYFLLAPFFICNGDAKVPLLFFSILTSWTIIGWIILIIIAIRSNFKFKRGY